jgi:hypothetical protein
LSSAGRRSLTDSRKLVKTARVCVDTADPVHFSRSRVWAMRSRAGAIPSQQVAHFGVLNGQVVRKRAFLSVLDDDADFDVCNDALCF